MIRFPRAVRLWLVGFLCGPCLGTAFAGDVTRLAPVTCVRAPGGPHAATYTFAASAGDGVLQVANGDETGARRATATTIVLNGSQVVGPDAFAHDVTAFQIPIALATSNTLVVRLEGAADSQVTLSVTQQVRMPRAYTYALLDIGDVWAPEGRGVRSDVRPAGINRRGDIVGSAAVTTTGPVSSRGFVRIAASGGTRLSDPTEGLHGAAAHATGINDAGDVVGYYTAEERRERGYLWDGSAYVSFDVPGAVSTFPSGINNRGQIAGYYRTDANHSKGFIKDGSSYSTIDIISDDVPHGTMIQGLNNVGQTVGYITVSKGADQWVSFAFLTNDGVFTMFNVPYRGSLLTMPYGINDSGLTVGTYFTGAATRGFLRGPSGTFLEIDVPGATSTFPTGINGDGTVVGYYWNGSLHGFTASPVW